MLGPNGIEKLVFCANIIVDKSTSQCHRRLHDGIFRLFTLVYIGLAYDIC